MPVQRSRDDRPVRVQPIGVIGTRGGGQDGTGAEIQQASRVLQGIADELYRDQAREAQEAGTAAAQAVALERDEAGNLVAPTYREGFRYYDEAHRKALRLRYVNELEADVRGRLGELAVAHDKDPDAFEAASREYLTTMIGVVDPGVRGSIAVTARALQQQTLNGVRARRQEQDLADSRAKFTASVNNGLLEVFNYAAAGSTASEDSKAHLGRMELQIAVAQTSRLINEAEADQLRRGIQTQIAAGALIRETRNKGVDDVGRVAVALRSGPGAEGWQPEWSALTPKEREALASDVMGIARAKEAIVQHETFLADRASVRTMALLQRQMQDYIANGQEPPKDLMDRLSILGTSSNPAAGMSIALGVQQRWQVTDAQRFREELASSELRWRSELQQGRIPLPPDVEGLARQGRSMSHINALVQSYEQMVGRATKDTAAGRALDEVSRAVTEGSVVVGPSPLHQKAGDAVMSTLHPEPIDYGKLTEAQTNSLMSLVRTGVVPAEAIRFMSSAIRSLDSPDPAQAHAGLALFQKIQADPEGMKAMGAANGLATNVRNAYLAFAHMADMGLQSEAGRKHVIEALSGTEVPEQDRLFWLGGTTGRENRQALRDELEERATPAASGVGLEGGTPWYKLPADLINFLESGEPGRFQARMGRVPPQMLRDYELSAEILSTSLKDKKVVLDEAFRQVQGKWGQSRYAVGAVGVDLGDYRWAPYPPETSYPIPAFTAAYQGLWVPEAVKAEIQAKARPADAEILKDKTLGQDYLLRAAHDGNRQLRNAAGKPLYHVVVINNGQLEHAYDKRGQMLTIDLAPAWKEALEGKNALVNKAREHLERERAAVRARDEAFGSMVVP